MKRVVFISAVLMALALPVTLHADEDDSDGFGARVSAEVDYKLFKGLHLSASEEIRLGGADVMDRSYTEVGLSYKINQHLKAGLSYTAIAVYESEVTDLGDNTELVKYWYDWRHRVSADLTASFKAGQWRFSLRERLQGTYKKRELNNYQQPQTAWVVRSRLKASYKFRTLPLEPYAFIEPRLLLNGAKWSDGCMTPDFSQAQFLGHADSYVNRMRGALGLEWRLDSRNSIDFYGFYDYLSDKEIDARKEGSAKGVGLKMPVSWKKSTRLSVGIAYKFSF